MQAFAVTAAICALAFLIGYSINQGGTCAVAAAREVVDRRTVRLLVGMAVASGAAGVVTLGLHLATSGATHLGPATEVAAHLLIGAAVFGVGAWVNDACLLGSLARLGDGEFRLLALPAGLAAGFWLATAAGADAIPAAAPSALAGDPAAAAWAALAFGALAGLGLTLLRLGERHLAGARRHRWPLGRAMLTLGVCGGALYALSPAWTYADLVHQGLAAAMAMAAATSVPAVLATVAGAVAAAHSTGGWRPRPPRASALARTFAGGALMGIGAAMIPGGNDGLLLSAVPAAAPGALAAFAVMTATVLACVALAPVARSRGAAPGRR